MAETTKTSMAMYNLYLLPDDNISKYRKEGENSWEGCSTVDDEKRHMVDFQAIG